MPAAVARAGPWAPAAGSWLAEAVAAPGDGEDQRRLLRLDLELLPQVADVDVDRARVAVGAVAPDRAQQLLAIERVAGTAHQPREQLVLAERQLDRAPVDADPALLLVERHRPDLEAALDDPA